MKLRTLALCAMLSLPAASKAAAAPRVTGHQLSKGKLPSKRELDAVGRLVDRTGEGYASKLVVEARREGRQVLLGARGLERGAEELAAAARGYDGLDLDLTGLPASRAEDAARLLDALRRLLPAPKVLTAAVDPGVPAFAILASRVEELTLLSDAPLSELEAAVERFAAAGAPKEKLALPVWLAGYAELAERLDIKEYDYSAPGYRWDAASGSAWKDGVRYENEASIRRKAEFARRAGLAGLALWDLTGARRPNLPAPLREALTDEARAAAAGEPAAGHGAPKPGDVVFVDSLAGGPDKTAWSLEGGRYRTRRRFAGVAVSLEAVPGALADGACSFGVRSSRARGRYCLALDGGVLAIRKAVSGGGGQSYFDLSSRKPLSPKGGKRRLTLSARDLADGRVALEARVDGALVAEGVDDGSVGGAPFLGAGRLALPASTAGLSDLEAVMLESAPQAPASQDTVKPVLFGVEGSVEGGKATISWTTDELTDGRVAYGLTANYESTTTASGVLSRAHSIELPALESGKTYHYRVLSADARGNVAASADNTLEISGGGRYSLAEVAAAPAPAAPPDGVETFKDDFNRPDGLVTNEYAEANPTAPGAVHSDKWLVTSGSMFVQGNAAWTGVPDGTGPNAGSTNATDSAVFRVVTKRQDFADVAVQFSMLNQGLTTTSRTPAQSYDGLHVFLRYRSEYELYYATVNRRDNRVTIKKKVPGGPSNGGTYYDLVRWQPYTVPYNSWQQVMATVRDNPDGSVSIALYVDGRLMIQATDDGSLGGTPLRGPGRVGIRGDNANLKWDDFTVTALPPVGGGSGGGGGSPAPTPGGATNVALGKLFTSSSYAGLGAEPDRANDADAVTRWQSEASDAQWLLADLGVAHELTGVLVRWGASYAKGYAIEVSQDGANWSPVYVQAAGNGGDEAAVFSPTTARYVRLNMNARSSSEGYVVRELEIQGTAPAGADVSPPEISEIEAVTTADASGSLTISWKTNEPATGRVDYGLTAMYGQATTDTLELVTRHSALLTGLEPGRAYHYRIRSRDASGNIGRTPDRLASFGSAAGDDKADEAKSPTRFLSPALADGYNDKALFGPKAEEVSIMDVRGKRVFKARRTGARIVWDCRDGAGRLVESGVYIARIVRSDSSVVFQSLAVVK